MNYERSYINGLDDLIRDLPRHTAMYVGEKDYKSVVCFIIGLDFASAPLSRPTNYLSGFTEWLDLKEGRTSGMHWSLRAAKHGVTDDEKIEQLCDTIIQFREDVMKHGVESIQEKHIVRFPKHV